MQLSSMTIAFGHSRRGKPFPMSPNSSAMHSTGHTTPHAPQSMHNTGSMMCIPFRTPVIASVGQRFVQAVQPIHVSRILYDISQTSAIQYKGRPEPHQPNRKT